MVRSFGVRTVILQVHHFKVLGNRIIEWHRVTYKADLWLIVHREAMLITRLEVCGCTVPVFLSQDGSVSSLQAVIEAISAVNAIGKIIFSSLLLILLFTQVVDCIESHLLYVVVIVVGRSVYSLAVPIIAAGTDTERTSAIGTRFKFGNDYRPVASMCQIDSSCQVTPCVQVVITSPVCPDMPLRCAIGNRIAGITGIDCRLVAIFPS